MSSSLAQPRRSSRRLSMASSTPTSSFSPLIKRRTMAPTDSLIKKAEGTPKTPLVLSREIQTPKPNIPKETPKTRYVDPVMSKLQRDLDSPSAAAHLRAKRALKSPNFRNKIYGNFDVPHERQNLVTAEELRPVVPKTIPQIFAGCKIYVEVRTGDDNRSAGIKNRLARDGIAVNDKLYKDTTHCVFKDGLLSTYKNAQKAGIPVINILWIDACISLGRLADTSKFKISNLDRYEHPELYKRIRRQKSMQPEISSLTLSGKGKSMTQEDTPKRGENRSETIVEQEDDEGMELTLQNTSTSITAVASMDVATPLSELDRRNQQYRRMTTFTPDPMEQTGFLAKLAIDRRRTLFTPQLSKLSDETMTPENSNVFSHDSSNTIVFNSINKIGKSTRRSVFDISMNIVEMNCKALSQGVEDLTGSDKKKDHSSAIIAVKETLHTQVVPVPGVVRKRKLFNCDSEDLDDGKENMNKSLKMPEKVAKLDKSLPQAYKTPQPVKKAQPKVDRRRTMTFFKTEKPKEVSALKPKTPVKPPAAATKFIVCTNMSSTDKHFIHAAILKLGGRVENEVTSRTTHIVSPNEDRTMNILRGVIRACTMVNVNWIHESLTANKWLDTAMYQHGICDTNRVYERSILGTKNYKNSTFSNHGLFFLNQETIDNPKKMVYLKEIIELCGGLVTDRKNDAKFIVSDKPLQQVGAKQIVIVSTYIFDAAMKGSFLDTASYQPKAQNNRA